MRHSGVILSLAALLTAFCLASCITTDRTLGARLVPTNQDITLHTATLDLPVSLKMADSLQTAVSQSITVGAIRTKTFGLLHCDAAMSVTAASDSIIWGGNPTVRSLTLNLVVDTNLVVNPSQLYIPQNFYIHQLNVELDSTMVYNNSLSEKDYNPEILSEGGFVYTGGDSYTVKLKEKIAQRLFEIPMATLDSAELFMKAFYGFYLRCDDPDEDLPGGRLNIFDLSSSYLNFTYDYDDDEGNRRAGTTSFLIGEYYNVNICSAGSREYEKADPADGLYMDGLCGIKPYIEAAQIKRVVEQWAAAEGIPAEKLLIAKATLSFPFEYLGDRDQFDYYPLNLFPCKRTLLGGKMRYTPLSEIEDGALETGEIDRSHLCYTSNVSLYLQKILRTDESALTASDNLWMMPTLATYNSNTGETFYYADYFYYAQGYLNGTADLRHPEIHLTYTVLK